MKIAKVQLLQVGSPTWDAFVERIAKEAIKVGIKKGYEEAMKELKAKKKL